MRDETTAELTSRRGALAGAGAVGLAGVLTACGGSSSSSSSNGAGGGDSSAPAPAPTSAGASQPQAAGGGDVLAKTSDIPVGGGKIFKDQKVVVTQPAAGQFKAFSATCTHMGCTVATIANGTIECPCHGSRYKISDASVVSGPAPRALPAKQITVTNGEIKLA